MKHFLFFVCTVLACVCRGQDQHYIIRLSGAGRLQETTDRPFDSVIVYDGRFDRSNVSVVQTTQGKWYFLLDGSLKEKAQAFFNTMVAGATPTHRQLLLLFRQLREVGGPMGLFTEVEAYIGETGGNFTKVGTISRTEHMPFFGQTVDRKLARTVRSLMTGVLLAAIDSCRATGPTGTPYPMDSLTTDIFHHWALTYPVARQGRFADGVYYSLGAFRNNQSEARELTMTQDPDSSYSLHLALRVDKPVYAVRYHDTFFFFFMQQFWLPLTVDGGHFSFYVPPDLPGIETRPYAPDPNAPPSWNPNQQMLDNAQPGSIEALQAERLEVGRRKILTRMLQEMKSKTYYLNLDTGEWALKDE